MKKVGQVQAENILKSKKRHKILRRVVAIVAAFVMLFTMNTLKKNANTLERIPTCGVEEHLHTDECYNDDGELICDLPEHLHTDACYQAAPVRDEEELILGEDEEIDLPIEEEAEAEPIAEPPVEEEAFFALNHSSLLSRIISAMELPVSLRDVQDAGQVVNNVAEAGRVGVSRTDDGDLLVSALTDFDRAELAIITNTDILTVTLANGVAAEESVAEAIEEPAVEEPAEAGQEETAEPEAVVEAAPADETVPESIETEETAPVEEEATEGESPEESVEEQTEVEAVEAETETEENEAVEVEGETEDAQVEAEGAETEEAETEEAEAVEAEAEETETIDAETENAEAEAETEETEAVEAREEDIAAEVETEEIEAVETEDEGEATEDEAEVADEGEATEDEAEATDEGEVSEDEAEATDEGEVSEDEAEAAEDETEDEQDLTAAELEAEGEEEAVDEETAEVEVVEQSLSVSVDLSSVDLMQAATVEGDTVSLSVSDLLSARDDAVNVEGDLDVDGDAFAAEAVVTEAHSDVTVEDGVITLSAEALESGTVTLEMQTETTEDDVTTVTTQTVDITLTGYTGRTTDAIDSDGSVEIVPTGNNSLPNDAYATMTQADVPENIELAATDTTVENAVAYEITIVNDNQDELSETGEVAVTVTPENLNVYSEVPEGAEPGDVNLELYQVNDDGKMELVPDAAFDYDDEGNVNSFSFTTDALPTYVVKYTVDFEFVDAEGVEHAWSFNGTGSRPLTEVLSQLGIEGDEITAADLKLTEVVGKYGAKDLYLTQDEESGEWYINSDAAFDDTYTLTVTASGVEYRIIVKDDVEYTVELIISDDALQYIQNNYANIKMHIVVEQTINEYDWGKEKRYSISREIDKSKKSETYNFMVSPGIGIDDVCIAYNTWNSQNAVDDNACKNGGKGVYNSFGDYAVTVSSSNSSATITIGDVGSTTYSASIGFKNEAGNDEVSPVLGGTYYLLAQVESNTYYAQITGNMASPISFYNISNDALANDLDLGKPASLKVTASKDWAAESVTDINGYSIDIPANATSGVYNIIASKPRTCTVSVAFKDVSNNDQGSPNLDSNYYYYVVAVKNDSPVGYARFTGPGTLSTFTGEAPDSAVTTQLWVVRSSTELNGVADVSSLQDKVTASGGLLGNYAFEWSNTPSGTTYAVTGKEKDIYTIALNFYEADGTTTLSSCPVSVPENYFVIARDGSYNTKYYAPINADGTIGIFKDRNDTEVSTLESLGSAQITKYTGEGAVSFANLNSSNAIVNLNGDSIGEDYSMMNSAVSGKTIVMGIKLKTKAYSVSMAYDPSNVTLDSQYYYLLIKERDTYKYYIPLVNYGFGQWKNADGEDVYSLETAYGFTFEMVKAESAPSSINDLTSLSRITTIGGTVDNEAVSYRVTMPTSAVEDGNNLVYRFTANVSTTYYASIEFFDKWSSTENDTENLVSGYTLEATVGNDIYEATISGTGHLQFSLNGGEPSAELPGAVSAWTFKNNGTAMTNTVALGGYEISNTNPAANGSHVYSFVARQPEAYTVSLEFYEVGATEPSVVTLPAGHTYTIEGVTEGWQTYVATLNENGEFTYSHYEESVDTIPAIATWTFKQDGQAVDNFAGYQITATPEVKVPTGQETVGNYKFTAQKQKTLKVTLSYLNGEDTKLADTVQVSMDGYYYLVATVNGTRYFATLTGWENSYGELLFKDVNGETVTEFLESATFELRKSSAEYTNLNDVINNASVVNAIGTDGDAEYQLGAATAGDESFALTAKEYIPGTTISRVRVELYNKQQTEITKNNILPENKVFHVVATLTNKSDSEHIAAWAILKVNRDDLNNNGVWQGDLSGQIFKVCDYSGSWQNNEMTAYDPATHDLTLRLYTNKQDYDNYRDVTEQNNGTDQAPEGYAFMGVFAKQAMGDSIKADSSLASDTAVIRLRESNPTTYAIRAYVDTAGLRISEGEKYVVRVTIHHESGGESYAYGILNIDPSVGPNEPVELKMLTGVYNDASTNSQKKTCWFQGTNGTGDVTLNETNYTVELLSMNSSDTGTYMDATVANLSQPKNFTVITEGDSVNGYSWTQGTREVGIEEDGVTPTYDVIRFSKDTGTLTVGQLQSKLSDATNFGLYTGTLLGQNTDMEANIGAGVLACSSGNESEFGFSNNNIQVNQIKVTKRWVNADGSGKRGETVNFNLYPVQGYNEQTGDYTGLGEVMSRSGVTDSNGVAEVVFTLLPSGYYLLKEDLGNGVEKAFSDGTNGVVSMDGGKKITFADGIIKIDNINVNVNYFGTVAEGVDPTWILGQKSRNGWIVTDDKEGIYDKLVEANQGQTVSQYGKISMTGSAEYPHTYNIPEDLVSLRNLSRQLAKAKSSSTVRVVNVTANYLNNREKLDIRDDGRYVVVNVDMSGAGNNVTLNPVTWINGVRLQAEFGKSGAEYSSRVLFNLVYSNGEPYTGTINTADESAGILLAPSAKFMNLGGNWGGTIICNEADRQAGGEIHSDSANKIQKINTLVTNAEDDQDTGDLEIQKKIVGGVMPDNTTWFTFTVSLKDAEDNPIDGTYVASGLRTGDSVTFENGEATVQVRANNKVTIAGIPAGYKYTVNEVSTTATEHFELVSIENDKGVETNEGTIGKNKTAYVIATNAHKVGGLTVRKTVIGDTAGTAQFHFKVSILNDDDDNVDETFYGRFGSMVFEKGEATFPLSNGESITATDIPTGKRFKVEELDHDDGNYETAVSVRILDPGHVNDYAKNTVDKSVTSTILANQDGQIAIIVSYTNTHTDGCTFKPKVSKQFVLAEDSTKFVRGDKWPYDGFTFQMEAVEGNPEGVTLPEDMTAKVTVIENPAYFNELKFEYVPSVYDNETHSAVYNFTIHEVVPEEGQREPGITYSNATVNLKITVQSNNDPLKPKLVVTSAEYDGQQLPDGATFINTYDSVTATPKVYKKVDGVAYTGTLTDGAGEPIAFNFQLTPVSVDGKAVENPVSVTAHTTAGSSEVEFAPFEYTKVGTYVYSIAELNESNAHSDIVYDGSTYYWRVVVAEGENGKLTKTVDNYYTDANLANLITENGGYPTFNNRELTEFDFIKDWLNGAFNSMTWQENTSIVVKMGRINMTTGEPDDNFYAFYTLKSTGNGISVTLNSKGTAVKDELEPTVLPPDIDDSSAVQVYRFVVSNLEKYDEQHRAYTYYVEERACPPGFNPRHGNLSGNKQDYVLSTDSSRIIFNIESSAVMPATGGMGTDLIYALGAGLLLLAALGWALRLRRRRDDA